MEPRTLKADIEELISAYADCLDDDRLEEWPDFFADDGVYRIVARENVKRNLPLATMSCEGKGMMKDRVVAIRQASVFSQRFLRHVVTNVRVCGQESDSHLAQANYVVFQTLQDEETKVFNVGQYKDKIVYVNGKPKFKERIVIYDSLQIPGLLVIPI